MSCYSEDMHCAQCHCGNITVEGELLHGPSEETLALQDDSISIQDKSLININNLDSLRCQIHCNKCNSSLYLVHSKDGTTGQFKRSRRSSDLKVNTSSYKLQVLPQCFKSLIAKSQSKTDLDRAIFDYNDDDNVIDSPAPANDTIFDSDEDDFNLMFSNTMPTFVGSYVESSMLFNEICA